MILSVSRRTDIPCCYPEWFFKRLEAGKVLVRNPYNKNQISEISLTPDVTDCIVFWTKNPEPMLHDLGRLDQYMYYFQFTLTGYGKDMEPGLPDKEHLISVFRRLSDQIGPNRVIWRYDPILFSRTYTMEYHQKAFADIARSLKGYTKQVVISLVDMYKRTRDNAALLGLEKKEKSETEAFLSSLARTAGKNGMSIVTCAEALDLKKYGIEHGSCIDRALIEELTGCGIDAPEEKGQRPECGCARSLDIGTYNTCKNGCRYCYANYSDPLMRFHISRYSPDSPLLCDSLEETDHITVRKTESWKNPPLKLKLELT